MKVADRQVFRNTIHSTRQDPAMVRELSFRHEATKRDFLSRAERARVATQGLHDRLTHLDNLFGQVFGGDSETVQQALDLYFQQMDEVDLILKSLEQQLQSVATHPPTTAENRERGGDTVETRLQTALSAIQPSDPNRWRLLHDALTNIVGSGVLQGSRSAYTFDDLFRQIGAAKTNPDNLRFITGAGGLYETVKAFLDADAQPQTPRPIEKRTGPLQVGENVKHPFNPELVVQIKYIGSTVLTYQVSTYAKTGSLAGKYDVIQGSPTDHDIQKDPRFVVVHQEQRPSAEILLENDLENKIIVVPLDRLERA